MGGDIGRFSLFSWGFLGGLNWGFFSPLILLSSLCSLLSSRYLSVNRAHKFSSWEICLQLKQCLWRPSYVKVTRPTSPLGKPTLLSNCKGLSTLMETWIFARLGSIVIFFPRVLAISEKVPSFQKWTGTPVTLIQKGVEFGKSSLVKGSHLSRAKLHWLKWHARYSAPLGDPACYRNWIGNVHYRDLSHGPCPPHSRFAVLGEGWSKRQRSYSLVGRHDQ